MNRLTRPNARWRHPAAALVGLFVLAALLPLTALAANPGPVSLGTADPFALLASSAISDVPTSTITGNVGLTPAAGSFITGLTCAEVTGTIYTVDATGPLPCRVTNAGLLTTANGSVTTAYVDTAGRVPDSTLVGADNQLGGQTLVAGVYRFGHATTANLIGNLTLTGDASSVFIFQATSDFRTAGSSTVTLTGGAQSCNVFWQVGSAATIGGSSLLRGTVLAHDDISVLGSATVDGRLLAGAQGAGALTLIQDTITRPAACVTAAQIAAAQAAAAAAAAAAAQAQAAAAAAQAAAAQAATDAAAAALAAKVAADAKAAADAAAKAAAEVKAAADAAAQAAAEAKAAADAAAKAAAAKNATAARVAAAQAKRAASVAKAKATAARVLAAKVAAAAQKAKRARAAASTTSTTHARPPIRHVGLTG